MVLLSVKKVGPALLCLGQASRVRYTVLRTYHVHGGSRVDLIPDVQLDTTYKREGTVYFYAEFIILASNASKPHTLHTIYLPPNIPILYQASQGLKCFEKVFMLSPDTVVHYTRLIESTIANTPTQWVRLESTLPRVTRRAADQRKSR